MDKDVKERIEKINWGEIPEGYKRTKIGIIPKDWNCVQLKDIAEISSGSTPSRNNKSYWGGRIPWVTTSEINYNEIQSTKEYITEEALNKCNLKLYEKGIILMAMYGQGKTRGKVAVLGIEASINQACAAIIVKKENNIFVYQQLRSLYDRIRRVSNIGSQENLNANIIKGIMFTIPPLREQQKIVDILEEYDNAISKIEDLIQEKKKQKKWLVYSLLVEKKRLPGFSGIWKTEKMEKLFDERVETNCENCELLSITSSGILPRTELESKDNSSDDKSKYKKIYAGDKLYNTMRMWQGVSALSEYEGIVSPAYTILAPHSNIDAKFFSYLFKLPSSIFKFYRFSQGLVDDTRNLKYDNFKRISLLYPEDLNEQKAIAEVLVTADKEIDLLEKKLALINQEKKAMMQLLFSGIVRVNDT